MSMESIQHAAGMSTKVVRHRRRKTAPRALHLNLPCMLLVGIWLGINSGPHILMEMPASLLGFGHLIRTMFPFFALAAPLLVSQRSTRRPIPRPLRLWLGYGLVSCAGLLFSPHPWVALYWVLCYFSVFAVVYAQIQRSDPLSGIRELNRWGWLVATIFLTIMAFLARDSFVSAAASSGGSLYGAYGQMDTVADMAMSRSSGLARFAAIPGLVAFVALWRGKLLARVIGFAISAICAWFVWQLQSRGAIFAFAGALVVSMVMLGAGARIILAMGLLMAGLFWSFHAITPETVESIGEYLRRGQSADEFTSMTGRTQVWVAGLQAAAKSPFIGYGPQADRFLLDEHIHNTYMYAIIAAGVPGLLLFVLGLLITWRSIARLAFLKSLRQSQWFTTFAQATALLTFFTIRSVTEVSGSLFAVDLMIMVPAMAYISILHDACFSRRYAWAAHSHLQSSKTAIALHYSEESPM